MANRPLGNSLIGEFHKDIVKTVAALPTPSAALSGFRRFRSSDNLEFYCDGTRWLSTTEYPLPFQVVSGFVNNLAATLVTAMWAPFPKAASTIYFTNLEVTHRTLTTFSLAANWTFLLNRGGGGGTYAAIGSVLGTWVTGRTAGLVYNDIYPVSTAYSVAGNTTRFSLDINKTNGAPGNMELTGATLFYRLVG
jgi:hypothetical protein